MWFGKTKEEKKPVDYYLIGRSGTLTDFEETFATLKKQRDPRTQMERLFKGIVDGFYEGRPESLQTVFAEPQKFTYEYNPRSDYDYGLSYGERVTIKVTEQLAKLVKGAPAGSNAADIVSRAFGRVPRDSLPTQLAETLYDVLRTYGKEHDLINALLDAGADPNAPDMSGNKGYITARAVALDMPRAVLQMFYDHGADFDVTRGYMQKNKWSESQIDRLEAYRAKVTGVAQKQAVQNEELLIQLAETVVELTRRVEALEGQKQKPSKKPAAKRQPEKETPLRKNPRL